MAKMFNIPTGLNKHGEIDWQAQNMLLNCAIMDSVGGKNKVLNILSGLGFGLNIPSDSSLVWIVSPEHDPTAYTVPG